MTPNVFDVPKPVYGFVTLPPLPSALQDPGRIDEVTDRALSDTRMLVEGGVDGLLVENEFDEPTFIQDPSPYTAVCMAIVCQRIKDLCNALGTRIPLGVNVKHNDYQASLAIAKAARFDMVWLTVFVDTCVSRAGVIYPCAAEALRYRRLIEASSVRILAVAQPSDWQLIAPKPLALSVEEAYMGGASTVVLLGSEYGSIPRFEEADRIKAAMPHIPLFAGSGVKAGNVQEFLSHFDGVTVNSGFRVDDDARNPVDGDTVREVVRLAQEYRVRSSRSGTG